MPTLLIQLDGTLLEELNRVASPSRRQRSEFVRRAIRDAIRRAQFTAMRAAYQRQPDSAEEADDWSSAEEFKT